MHSNDYYRNFAKPLGNEGRELLEKMNQGHRAMADWAFSFMPERIRGEVLDMGCGGGANLCEMLRRWPEVHLCGADYSSESVRLSKLNTCSFGSRCDVVEAEVHRLPFGDKVFRLVTAFETVYYWHPLMAAFTEIRRVMADDGLFYIVLETDDNSDTTWTSKVPGMVIYTELELRTALLTAGFRNIELIKNDKGWLILWAK